ncbi:hypothetical protein CPC08DRAFT_706880 [Agrocybe pediades]|nr:hypothetical protein CPC08DRAFT_706880 [Agrocybe pediades]
MGQSSSRHQDADRSAPVTPVNPAASTSSAAQQEPPTGIDARDTTGSRRSSLRKNILKLVKPKSIRNRMNGVSSNSREENGSWRDSRRWSKSPASSSKPADNIVPEGLAEESITASSSSRSKGKQREDKETLELLDEDISNDATASSAVVVESKGASVSDPVEASSSSSAPMPQDEHDTAHILPSSRHERALPELPSRFEGTEHETTSSPSPQSSASQQVNVPPRHFPPPGTLVVVQGIVHTTDVSRPIGASTSSSAEDITSTTSSGNGRTNTTNEVTSDQATGRTRSRLSSLLRPRSVSSRPSSVLINDPPLAPATAPVDVVPSESQPVLNDSTQTEVITSTVDEAVEAETPRVVDASPSTTENRSPSISSSSIDVLGTLLSVAAAATAASLLTGSSDPILSSGLAPSDTSSPSASVNPSSYPRLPTAIGNSSMPDVSAGRADRMRQAWGSIRERLGLRPSSSSPSAASPPLSSQDGPVDPTTSSVGPTDTRELMLAEMARAFNIGLGLNNMAAANSDESHSVPAEEPTNSSSDNTELPSPPPGVETGSIRTAPEGSFERFLVDLQSDLRTALTHQTENPGQMADNQDAAAQVPSASAAVPQAVPEVVPEPVTSEQVAATPDMESPSTAPDMDSNVAPDTLLTPEESSSSDHGETTDDSTRNTSPEGSRRPGTGRIDASGRINWWRLYRFPPISPPSVESTTLGQPGSQPTSSPVNGSNSARAPDATEPAAPGNASRLPMNSIVPVIVVGLQSVSPDWRMDIPVPDDSDLFGAPPSDTLSAESAEGPLDNSSAPRPDGINLADGETQGPRGNGRSRGWHSRAASAIRNLRPGRRNVDVSENRVIAVPGSRTFLIYVIGGYYPPEHSIVTGGPDSLDSFEALLELADLLGQVKPPTVTKDDIEKSGLQIIKASEMAQYEKDGKVSSNCLDRCLICLDDYEPEDPIRVMSCRHAFHRTCVDEWLQKGRNNCPACRSTGVNTDVPTRSEMQEPL